MAERKLYRVAPGAPEWLTEEDMIDRIKRWAANAPEYGAPSVTVSTLVVPDTEPDGVLEICGNVAPDGFSICVRSPAHGDGPHRDHEPKGLESSSWDLTS